jgi:integrase
VGDGGLDWDVPLEILSSGGGESGATGARLGEGQMTQRRLFGRVRKLASGRYQARYPTLSGELIPAEQTFTTRREAERHLAAVETDQNRGAWVDYRRSRILLSDYANDWLANRTLKPSTRSKYRGLLDRQVLPSLGHHELGQVNPSTVRSWNAALHTAYPDTAAQAYRLLAAIFNTAVDDDLLIRSPCRVKGASQYKNPERPVLSVEEIGQVVEVVEGRYRVAIQLAVWCQLRRAEILGLQRRHINIDAGTIAIDQTWTSVNGTMVLGSPKCRTPAALGTCKCIGRPDRPP